MSYTLEIIGFNIESCIGAQRAGAQRIELCASPGEGGTTPSYGFIKAARAILQIPLYVMIRPRGGDFLYSTAEFSLIKDEIEVCKQLGCEGIVTGMLTREGNIDMEKGKRIMEWAFPMKVTFHRAFDRVADPRLALEDVISLGCERILTSGCKPKASEAIPLLKDLVDRAGDRISIMPGSGVNPQNIRDIARQTGAKEFHSSASVLQLSNMDYHNPSMQKDLQYTSVNEEAVEEMIRILDSLN